MKLRHIPGSEETALAAQLLVRLANTMDVDQLAADLRARLHTDESRRRVAWFAALLMLALDDPEIGAEIDAAAERRRAADIVRYF
jgi:hypothetical protein